MRPPRCLACVACYLKSWTSRSVHHLPTINHMVQRGTARAGYETEEGDRGLAAAGCAGWWMSVVPGNFPSPHSHEMTKSHFGYRCTCTRWKCWQLCDCRAWLTDGSSHFFPRHENFHCRPFLQSGGLPPGDPGAPPAGTRGCADPSVAPSGMYWLAGSP